MVPSAGASDEIDKMSSIARSFLPPPVVDLEGMEPSFGIREVRPNGLGLGFGGPEVVTNYNY